MKQYENLEHTADLKIKSYGKTKEEVFINMAKGMFANISEPKNLIKKKSVKREIELKANDLASLLVDFLNQLIYLSDVYNEIYFDYDISIWHVTNNHWQLEDTVKGYKSKGFKLEIKAATYNDLKLEEQGGNWVAEVVFDI